MACHSLRAPVRNDPDFNHDISRLVTTIHEHFPSAVKPTPTPVNTPPIPAVTVVAPTPNSPFKLPWAGILGGVLLVIAVLATMRVISRIADNIAGETATAVAQTATAQATRTPATSTPDVLATAEQIILLTQQAATLPATGATGMP